MEPSLHHACRHCGEATLAGELFCCRGCESVFTLLRDRGLTHFYQLRQEHSFAKPRPAPRPRPQVFESHFEQRFYIEGIHCLGCLWLLEKLPEIEPRILSAQLDLPKSILSLKIDLARIEWEEATNLIASLGYSALAFADENGEAARKFDQRQQLVRLGVAAFSAGNVMLMAVAIYAGASGAWAEIFRWLSAGLAAPALLYSALPIYRSALLPLRHGRVSVDLAIALALIAGMALSAYNLWRGSSETYFDSLTMLVFLLLSSRYFLQRYRESLGLETPFLAFFSAERFGRVQPEPGIVGAEALNPGDTFLLQKGQALPVDSAVKSEAYFDFSLLTGESQPVKVLALEMVDAGAKLLSPTLLCEAKLAAKESRLARTLAQIHAFQSLRSPSRDLAERSGKYFVFVVLTLAAALLFAMPTAEGVARALALVIVTCPCVLAFSVPLALGRALQSAARRGWLFREPEKIEALARARHYFFDKTGTLTTGKFTVKNWQNLSGTYAENSAAVVALEAKSSHPVALALLRHCAEVKPAAVDSVEPVPGQGMRGILSGRNWEILRGLSDPKAGENVLYLRSEGELRARITLGDSLRAEALPIIRALQSQGIEPVILSGDTETNVAAVANALGIAEWHSRLTPEEKAKVVATRPQSAMVGDGANDAVAFKASSVGIAVQGAVDLSLRNSDLALAGQGISAILPAVKLAREAMRLVRANFFVTISYNLVAGSLALLGHMNPLLAAILMPASALTVFSFTQWQTRGRRL